MERVLCLLMGYVFGLFQTGYLYSRSKHMDIRNYGSGNSGSTNVLRVMGKKAGLIVFLGDAGKMIAACLITRVLFRSQPELLYVYLLYTGFGVILGHNFPFYMEFKGGKGIAASAGLLASNRLACECWSVWWCLWAAVAYPLCIPGSILVMICFFIGMVFFGARGDFGIGAAHLTEFYVLAGLISAMGIWRHHTNIKRLLSGTENQAGCQKGIDLWQM